MVESSQGGPELSPSAAIARPVAAIRLDGGRPCLDFVNSIHDWSIDTGEDYIASPERYLEWSARVGLIVPEEVVVVPTNCQQRKALMTGIRALRSGLHDLFTAQIEDASPAGESVDELNRWLQAAWQGLAVDRSDPSRLSWRPEAVEITLPLKRIALDALEQLRDPEPDRLKRCRAEHGCGWLFRDGSKNNRRQWCAMEVCGTIHKMATYRRRNDPKEESV